jgi:hypothetical protein
MSNYFVMVTQCLKNLYLVRNRLQILSENVIRCSSSKAKLLRGTRN